MRLKELLNYEKIDSDDDGVRIDDTILITEVEPTGPLNPEQARKRQERNAKKSRRAAEITSTAAAKAAAIRADIT